MLDLGDGFDGWAAVVVRGVAVRGAVFLSFADWLSFLVVSEPPPPITEVYTDLTSFAEDFKNPNRLAKPFGFAYLAANGQDIA